jgi:type VI secretion system protein ImpL
VDSQLQATAFQPVQLLTPPSSKDQLVGDKTKAYMGALLSVQASLQQLAGAPSGSANPAVAQALNDAGAAGVAARQLAQGFSIDSSSVGPEVERLLLAPATAVPPLLSGLGASGLNQRGRQFCAPLQRLMAEVPFRPAAERQAALSDVASQFQRGTGAIWSFYNDALQTYLERQGPRYGQRPGADLTLTSGFIEFFNRAAAFSEAVFPEGAQSPRVSFTFKPVLSARVPQVVLAVDGQTATFTRTNTAAQLFLWDGLQAQDAHVIARIDGSDVTLSMHGTWAVFLLFQAAQDWQTTGALQRASWMMRHNGEEVPVPFELNLGGAGSIFSRNYFSGVSCNGQVAR